jgi:hypothetical protein
MLTWLLNFRFWTVVIAKNLLLCRIRLEAHQTHHSMCFSQCFVVSLCPYVIISVAVPVIHLCYGMNVCLYGVLHGFSLTLSMFDSYFVKCDCKACEQQLRKRVFKGIACCNFLQKSVLETCLSDVDE